MTFPLFHHVIHFPWLLTLLELWASVASWLWPDSNIILDSYGRLEGKVHELREHPELVEHEEHETIFHHLLQPHPEKGQPEILSEQVLWEEAKNLIAAGGETVATTVNVGVFHVLNNAVIHARLLEELRSAWPELETVMRYETLQKLPYLVRDGC